MKQRKSDILWKVVMEEIFDDLLRFVMPNADQEYDMNRGFEFLEKELAEMYPDPDKESDTRFADKLVKVFDNTGQEDWILFHIEVQGDSSRKLEFAERMFRYFYRIRDRYGKPVAAVAIFTGEYGRNMPGQYTYQYKETRVLFEYRALSIQDFTDEELEQSNNPFALVVLAARTSLLEGKMSEMDLLERKWFIAKLLLKKGYAARKVRAIMVFLESYVLFEDPEMNRIFTERVRLNDKSNIMGTIEFVKQEAEEIGRIKEKASVVMNLLRQTDFTNEKIADIVGVSVAFVEEVRKGKK